MVRVERVVVVLHRLTGEERELTQWPVLCCVILTVAALSQRVGSLWLTEGGLSSQPTRRQTAGWLSPLARSHTGTQGESPGVSRCHQEIKISQESVSLNRLILLTQPGSG